MSDKQRERPGVRETDWYRNHLTDKQRATGIFSGGRIFNFKEGWAKVIGTWGKAHYFKVDEEFTCEDPADKLAVSSCGKAYGHVNDAKKDQLGLLYGEGNVPRCKICERKRG